MISIASVTQRPTPDPHYRRKESRVDPLTRIAKPTNQRKCRGVHFELAAAFAFCGSELNDSITWEREFLYHVANKGIASLLANNGLEFADPDVAESNWIP